MKKINYTTVVVSLFLSASLSAFLFTGKYRSEQSMLKDEFNVNITPEKISEKLRLGEYILYDYTSGKKTDTKSLQGKVVLLNFFEPWCKACNKEFPLMQKLGEEYKNNDKFVILAVASGEDMDMLYEWMKKWNYKNIIFAIDKSQTLTRFFRVSSIPATYLIEKNGKINHKMIGDRNYYSRSFRNYIDYLIK